MSAGSKSANDVGNKVHIVSGACSAWRFSILEPMGDEQKNIDANKENPALF
jgi:hypothetical protein